MAFNTIGISEFRNFCSDGENKNYFAQKNDVVEIPSILGSDLTCLTPGQGITLTVVVSILCGLSVVGNIGALYANRKRKIRLFFRFCLISLAVSDLIQTVFMSTGYLAQFAASYVQVWCLGDAMCTFIPFVTTGAILAGSMTLVGIAMDRYFAVMSSVLGSWNPSKRFCIVSTTSIWAMSYGIASPMFSAYSTYRVYILTTLDFNYVKDIPEIVGMSLVDMCVSEKKSNAYYYIVVLAIIFIPTLVAFIWLNSIIANKLWIRRRSIRAPPPPSSSSSLAASHPRQQGRSTTPTPTTTSLSTALSLTTKPQEKLMAMASSQQHFDYDHHACHCNRGSSHKICSYSTLTVPTRRSMVATTTTTITTTTTMKSLDRRENNTNTNTKSNNSNTGIGTGTGSAAGGNSAKHISTREARHLRMFAIVLILMAVFIFFRLPAWVFLIMRMYGTYTSPVHWILHFSFGILTLTSCVLNPLLYTFLAETIQYTLFMKGKLCGLRRFFATNCDAGNCERNISHCCNSNDGNDNDDDNDENNKDNKDNDNKMTHIQKQIYNVKKQNVNNDDGDDDGGYGDGHDKNENDDDYCCCCCKDGASNDGAKSTSKKCDEDSNAKVYTIIIPVLQKEAM